MKCARCTNEIPEGNQYCPSCGLKLKLGQKPQQQPVAPSSDASPYKGMMPTPVGPQRGSGGWDNTLDWIQERRIWESKTFLTIALIYLGLFAFLSAVIIGFGGVAVSSYQILSVMSSIAIFAFAFIVGYMLLERNRYIPFGVAVIIASGLAILFSFVLLGSMDVSTAKIAGVINLLAIFGCQTALLLLIDCDEPLFRGFLFGTIGAIWLLALFIIILIVSPSSLLGTGGAFLKALSVFAVLDIVGTVMTILVWRLCLVMGDENEVS